MPMADQEAEQLEELIERTSPEAVRFRALAKIADHYGAPLSKEALTELSCMLDDEQAALQLEDWIAEWQLFIAARNILAEAVEESQKRDLFRGDFIRE